MACRIDVQEAALLEQAQHVRVNAEYEMFGVALMGCGCALEDKRARGVADEPAIEADPVPMPVQLQDAGARPSRRRPAAPSPG